MRFLNGRRGQAYFRVVSLLNTPLFAGFPGFATKLWMAADEEGKYRGLYEWDDARLAEDYVRRCGGHSPSSAASTRSAIECCPVDGATTSSSSVAKVLSLTAPGGSP